MSVFRRKIPLPKVKISIAPGKGTPELNPISQPQFLSINFLCIFVPDIARTTTQNSQRRWLPWLVNCRRSGQMSQQLSINGSMRKLRRYCLSPRKQPINNGTWCMLWGRMDWKDWFSLIRDSRSLRVHCSPSLQKMSTGRSWYRVL